MSKQIETGDNVIIGSVADVELLISETRGGVYDHFTATIEIIQVGGTGIGFTVGKAVNATKRLYQVGEKLVQPFMPSKSNIHAKSDDATDIFSIHF